MLLRIGCQFEYQTPGPTPSLWQVRPRSDVDQRIVGETWEPPAPSRIYLDAQGNAGDRLTLPPGRSLLRYEATVEVPPNFDDADKGASEAAIEELPDETLVYLLPSRFCWPDIL